MYILFYNSNVYYNIVVILVAQFAYKLPCQIKKIGASNKSSNIESMLLSCQALPYLKKCKSNSKNECNII